MPPTQSILTPAPTPTVSYAKPPTHRPSIPALVVLALLLAMMATLAIGVLLRQRRAMQSLTHTPKKHHPFRWFSRRLTPPITDNNEDDEPTAVGTLHATSVMLAAAPCHVFSSPMTMRFRIPLRDETVLVLGAPWFPGPGCRAQYCPCGPPPVPTDCLGPGTRHS